ncbi:MAG: hypothetical protein U0Z26_01260 [Anaerolineales bacterium]
MNATSLAIPGFPSDLRAFWAVACGEWVIFIRYPSWIISLLIWPILFPMGYILTARVLSGTDGSGLTTFQKHHGINWNTGYIAGHHDLDVAKTLCCGRWDIRCGMNNARHP